MKTCNFRVIYSPSLAFLTRKTIQELNAAWKDHNNEQRLITVPVVNYIVFPETFRVIKVER